MATQVKYEFAECRNLTIGDTFENIEKVLKDYNIIPTYHEHLKQINICILMFEELETGRSYGEMFSDWADGTRKKVINKELIQRLRDLKKEILTGISHYTRLLVQKDDIGKVFLKLTKISMFKLGVKHEKVPEVSVMNKIGTGALYVGSGEVVGAAGGAVGGFVVSGLIGAIGAIYANYATLAVSISTFKLIASATGSGAVAGACVGAVVGAAAGAVLLLIYAIAKNKGKKRGLKYQQIIDLKDALDSTFLGTIQTNHEILKQAYDTIHKEFRTKGIKTDVAKYIYSNKKKQSLEELKNEGMDERVCKIMSEREAKMECVSFLVYFFQSSDEEAEEITTLVKNLT